MENISIRNYRFYSISILTPCLRPHLPNARNHPRAFFCLYFGHFKILINRVLTLNLIKIGRIFERLFIFLQALVNKITIFAAITKHIAVWNR